MLAANKIFCNPQILLHQSKVHYHRVIVYTITSSNSQYSSRYGLGKAPTEPFFDVIEMITTQLRRKVLIPTLISNFANSCFQPGRIAIRYSSWSPHNRMAIRPGWKQSFELAGVVLFCIIPT